MMTNADKMFEELGFKKSDIYFEYSRHNDFENTDLQIDFDERYENVLISTDKRDGDYATITSVLKMAELKAINEKCKELGWLDD